MAAVELHAVSKRYADDAAPAVDDVSVAIPTASCSSCSARRAAGRARC